VFAQLEAIRQTNVDMQVYLGNYNLATDDNAAYNRQKQVISDAITTYGTNHIAGVTVGNEYMLKHVIKFLSNVSHLICILPLAMSSRMEVGQQTVLLAIKVQHSLFRTLKTREPW
jgi:hypothetical protein